jgi:hypothetical protein
MDSLSRNASREHHPTVTNPMSPQRMPKRFNRLSPLQLPLSALHQLPTILPGIASPLTLNTKTTPTKRFPLYHLLNLPPKIYAPQPLPHVSLLTNTPFKKPSATLNPNGNARQRNSTLNTTNQKFQTVSFFSYVGPNGLHYLSLALFDTSSISYLTPHAIWHQCLLFGPKSSHLAHFVINTSLF